mmetsp:Transcript_23536/g.32134  ORF Transcript_23536/g.32134 Transcript_23536/m.32134 type:complete len:102 (-) Transcript_23536:16-321(-)
MDFCQSSSAQLEASTTTSQTTMSQQRPFHRMNTTTNVHHLKLNLALSRAMRPIINQNQATNTHTEAISLSSDEKPFLRDKPKSEVPLNNPTQQPTSIQQRN